MQKPDPTNELGFVRIRQSGLMLPEDEASRLQTRGFKSDQFLPRVQAPREMINKVLI